MKNNKSNEKNLCVYIKFNDGTDYLTHCQVVTEQTYRIGVVLTAAEILGGWTSDTIESFTFREYKSNGRLYDNGELLMEKSWDKEDMQQCIDDVKSWKDLLPSTEVVNDFVMDIYPNTAYNRRLRNKLKKMSKSGQCPNAYSIDDSELCHTSGWYLHGLLEGRVGYDGGCVVNAKTLGLKVDTVQYISIRGYGNEHVCERYIDKPFSKMKFNGICKARVFGVHGDCYAFMYTEDEFDVKYDKGTFPHWSQRGYVCANNDKIACIQALKHYLDKACMI